MYTYICVNAEWNGMPPYGSMDIIINYSKNNILQHHDCIIF